MIASLVDTMGSLALASRGLYMTGVSIDMSQTSVAHLQPFPDQFSTGLERFAALGGTGRYMRLQSASKRTSLADHASSAQLCSRGKTRPDSSDTERTGQHGSVLVLFKASFHREVLLVRRQA